MTIEEAKNLWVGDEIYLLKSKRKGLFAGITADKKVIMKIGDKTVKSTPANVSKVLTVADDWKEEIDKTITNHAKDENEITKSKSLQKSLNFYPDTIDLHLEKLSPTLVFSNTQRALDFQIEKCKEFLDISIDRKRHSVTIIHGKGQGILKNHIHALLQNYREVTFYSESNKGGATEVLLNY
jgi:dsDNA-specific endonuclease/ATPase MutS2